MCVCVCVVPVNILLWPVHLGCYVHVHVTTIASSIKTTFFCTTALYIANTINNMDTVDMHVSHKGGGGGGWKSLISFYTHTRQWAIVLTNKLT